MYRELFERADLPEELKRLRGETMGTVFLTCASIARQCGETGRSAAYVGSALISDPLAMFRRHFRVRAGRAVRSMAARVGLRA